MEKKNFLDMKQWTLLFFHTVFVHHCSPTPHRTYVPTDPQLDPFLFAALFSSPSISELRARDTTQAHPLCCDSSFFKNTCRLNPASGSAAEPPHPPEDVEHVYQPGPCLPALYSCSCCSIRVHTRNAWGALLTQHDMRP